ncbi:putative O-glycosylation ligase, exosortase A system-associated [Roseomonas marmotae]|uniref:O-glycosylation ligase, exosortase A system-associated n=1 Tax=Roseomonas marmotae TaxID=2768161 RepID=A0ABS3KHM0_9PROT|nr:putative O-glycosylation ligase, exosortase A system-associated [Roseomonas marmotae]MBO1076978.1 putative O-glycosylation ligase, exosortase A system-associated [Roseomonas marmotae]QTI80065.1 putative O-glycosylation ligase, exosortase A system-associated [Roseomonas marmotae]
MRSLYLTLVYLSFLGLGAVAPFVLTLGYVWVDTFTPQDIAYSILTALPVSALMGAAAIGGYFLFDRKAPAPFSVHTALTLMLAGWVTVTTFFFAVSPASAVVKWDWAFKTILISAFIPLVIRSYVQIEAFLQVYIFSLAIHIMPYGIKSLISGGGYGQQLGVVSGNSGFAEGSTLAAVSLYSIPGLFYLSKHAILLPKKYIKYLYFFMIAVFIACAIGTYARTALIGLIVLGVALWLRSDKKILGAILGAMVAGSIVFFTSNAWEERISTIGEYKNEDSALGRILVWQWTLGFVATHPAGGGFNAYEINEVHYPGEDGGEAHVVRGKAFHSIYFEVLGEHGWPGAILYAGLVLTTFLSLHRSGRRAKMMPALARCRDLAIAMQVSLLTLLVCGAFIGIAFQPMLFYSFALAACMANYTKRALAEAGASLPEEASWGLRSPARQGAAAISSQGAPAAGTVRRSWRLP